MIYYTQRLQSGGSFNKGDTDISLTGGKDNIKMKVSKTVNIDSLSIGADVTGNTNKNLDDLSLDYALKLDYKPTDKITLGVSAGSLGVSAGIKIKLRAGGIIYKLQTGGPMYFYGRTRDESRDHRLPVPAFKDATIKEHQGAAGTPFNGRAYMKFRKDTPEEIAAAREARIAASVKARKVPWTTNNWRERMAMETAATGDKLSLQQLPVIGKYIPNILDATGGIGYMASALGSAPLRAQQTNSIKPYLYAAGMPLVVGAVAGIGAKGTTQFANNVVNPLAGTGADKFIKNIVRAKIIPKPRVRVLPETLTPSVEYIPNARRFEPHTKISLLGKNKKEYGFIELENKSNYAIDSATGKIKLDPVTQNPIVNAPEWGRAHMIKVDDALRGNKAQDVLYELGIQEAKKKGMKGLYSGEDLMMPEATAKAYNRFNREIFSNKETTFLKEIEPGLHINKKITHDVVGLTGHKNPNVVADWMAAYKKVNKFAPREFTSIKKVVADISEKIPGLPAVLTKDISGAVKDNVVSSLSMYRNTIKKTLKPVIKQATIAADNIAANNMARLMEGRAISEAPLPKSLEPYISKRVFNDSKEQQVFESAFPAEQQSKYLEERTVYYDSDGNIIPKPDRFLRLGGTFKYKINI